MKIQTNMQTILGIDPGTATTGFGVIKMNCRNTKVKNDGLVYVAHGTIKTPVGMIMGERLLMLRQNLRKIIRLYKPQTIIIEQLFFGRNAKTAMTVGQARGVVMVTAAEQKITTCEYQGLWVKKKLVGDGHASKHQIQQFVRRTLGLYKLPRPDDAADALALAICFSIHDKKD
ncbi:MAG: crossover junction endodeoxyribonuclease RuvC [Candidatus Gottesmanbacteria bacterium]